MVSKDLDTPFMNNLIDFYIRNFIFFDFNRKEIKEEVFILAFVILLFLTTCFGCFVGGELFSSITPLRDEWQMLGKPPEPILEFHSIDLTTVYVKTKNGKLFSCYYVSSIDNECWIEIEQLPEAEYGFYDQETFDWPEYPEQITDSIGRRYISRFDISARYVLLPDGNVMQHLDGVGTLESPNYAKGLFQYEAIGSIVAFISCFIFILIFAMRLDRHKKKQQY